MNKAVASRKSQRAIIKATLALFGTWLLLHLVYTTIDGLTDKGKDADVAVILGNKINKDGTLSGRLKNRLACGLNLYRTGRVKKIIVSGGLGKEGFYEGDKMRDFLVAEGVPGSLVIVDNHGDNTLATVNNTIHLKDSLHFKGIIVVSQFFHLTRTKMLFRKKGVQNVSSVSPKYFEIRDFYALLREFAAYYSEL